MKQNNAIIYCYRRNSQIISSLIILIILPNLLGLINISTPWEFKIHFFQLAIFIAAILYGPQGGLFAGALGSLSSALLMHNPYIIIGNTILGLFVGLFFGKGFSIIWATLFAYSLELPWLILTDHYLLHLSFPAIERITIALAISNLLWALCAYYLIPLFKKLPQNIF